MQQITTILRFARFAVLAATLVGQATALSAESTGGARYVALAPIPGPDGEWDYSAVDPQSRRLYLARSGVAVLDLETGKWLNVIEPGSHVSGVIPVPPLGKLIFSEGKSQALVVYDIKAQKVSGSIPSPKGRTDAVAYDTSTHTGALMTALGPKAGDDGVATLVDVEHVKLLGTVPLGGRPEFAVSDNKGNFYINVSTNKEIAVLDEAKRQVVRRIPLSGCTGASGLAYEASSGLLISACGNNVAKIVRASDGADIATLPIGRAPDGVIIDQTRHRAFIPAGMSGNITVIDLSDAKNPRVSETLATQGGARNGALDPRTGNLYIPAADEGPPIPPAPWPSSVPGTFKLLVFAPK